MCALHSAVVRRLKEWIYVDDGAGFGLGLLVALIYRAPDTMSQNYGIRETGLCFTAFDASFQGRSLL